MLKKIINPQQIQFGQKYVGYLNNNAVSSSNLVMINQSKMLCALQLKGNQLSRLDLDNSEALTDLEVVRVVANKRVVCKCAWKNQLVFAKIFFGKNAYQYAMRDQQGSKYLTAANIPTPPLLAVQTLKTESVTVLIYKAVLESINAEEAYEAFEASKRKVLVTKLIETLAKHHRSSLIQTDVYLKNFLWAADEIYSIDGDGIKQYKSLSRYNVLKNLTKLLSKLDVLDIQIWILDMIDYYHAVNPAIKLDAQNLKNLSSFYRTKASTSYADKKVFRQCTDVIVNRGNHYFSAISSRYGNMSFSKSDSVSYDDLMYIGSYLKDGNTCSVTLAKVDNLSVVIKRYNIKSAFHAIGRMFRKSRAATSWANAHRLQLLGIDTANPIVLFECRLLRVFRSKAYFVSEYVDAPDISVFFNDVNDKKIRSKAVKQVAELFYRLYLLKISHGDMKATNIKVLADGRPLLIDLDSMQQHKHGFFAKRAHVRDIKRFMQNWKDEPSLYNAFVKGFKVVYADHSLLQAAQISQ